MPEGYSNVLKKALAWAKENFPNSSQERRAAFANSVAYAVTGLSGGYGGPSVREHTASRVVAEHGYSPNCHLSFERAVEVLGESEGVIFGPLTDLHRFCWESEHCFDDDPADLAELGQ